MTDDELLRLDDVSVSYDGRGTWALHHLDLVIRPGDRWVVLGPNGCGKSTLVQIATGYLHPSSGALTLLGGQLGRGVDWRVLRRNVGFVGAALAKLMRPQLPARDIVMTAKFGALEPWWHEYSEEDRTRAYDLLAVGGFGYLAEREFGVLSEGERQQVLLARSLMVPPRLLVLDEPAAGLDLGARERLLTRLTDVAADVAVGGLLLVTHHVEEIPVGATHALLLRGGAAVAAGPIAEVLNDANVSSTFGLTVRVRHDHGRFTAHVRPSDRSR